ncbi:putative sugar nucleotidyl transferase [Dyadobacter sp. MSC1_007]|jgi:UDP-N-acetylglucosamine diphosphorylase/glucosamine-1-phosphate N-acetyltransferase|uniref:putative sugar nucleotidyl transferase n=1 Tax=Dyadobacter sp. MSC1_007 TaxID=2909264 RepID=UPI00202F8B20|nr:putative sugar nucleotidyl transferase [Dyadobacter sp. MSC1_007]
MPNIILFDDPALRIQLLPFTYTRPVAKIRCGIHTLSEKWADRLHTTVSFQTEAYLTDKFPLHFSGDNLFINGALCPDDHLTGIIKGLPNGAALISDRNEVLAVRTSSTWHPTDGSLGLSTVNYAEPFTMIRNVWDIFTFNGAQIKADYERIASVRKSVGISDPFTHCYNSENVFVEEGAVIKASILNAENGPIYIGKNALIQEGSMIQGPFAIGDNAVLAQGTKIRPNTTVGPSSKVGGEVSNCVIFGYSNKGHDGYLGNSVLGEWCNLGANTNNSNLKNDHSSVKLHSYASNALADTGLLFCGLMMGDYSKAGISTMFNTGTVVGVSVNVFGAGFQDKHVPSFSWGGTESRSEYRFDKALAVARDTVSRRGIDFTSKDEAIMRSVFDNTKSQRES